MIFFRILKGKTSFEWTEKCERAFKDLKEYLESPPLLVKPKLGNVIQLYLVVSDYAVSLVLLKSNGKEHKLIFYVCKVFFNVETWYSNLEKLIYAFIVLAQNLRLYIESHTIEVVTTYPLGTVLHKLDLAVRMAL